MEDRHMRRGADQPRVRATPPISGPGVILLGQVVAKLPVVDVACNRGDRRSRQQTDRLVAEHGARTAIPALLRIIAADCRRMQTTQIQDVYGHPPAAVVGVGVLTAPSAQ
jgi:hypothetical protein